MSEPIMQLTVTGNAGPAVAALLGSLRRPEPVLQVGAQAIVRALRDHFRTRDAQPNRQGWPKTHFWRQFSRGVGVASTSNTEAVVSVAHPAIRHKIEGGTITPKRGKFLAIPAMAAAYAAGSPREGAAPDNLAFAYSQHPQGGWRPSLVVQTDVVKEVGKPRKDGTRRSKLVRQAGEIWYWLVRSATQAPDPDTLPSPELLESAARGSMLDFLMTSYGRATQL